MHRQTHSEFLNITFKYSLAGVCSIKTARKHFFSLRPVYFRRSLPNPAASGGRCSIGNQQCRSILHFGNNYRAVGKHVYNLRKVAAALKSDFIGLPVGQQCMGHGLNRITGIFFFDC